MTDRRHVFIVTSGRTGSTLLLGMLNAHPGVFVRGENYGFFYYQYKALEALRLSRSHVQPDAGSRSPFFGADSIDLGAITARIAMLCRETMYANVPDEVRVTGFKEIRYDMPDLEDYLYFLAAMFRPATFAFLLRDPANIAGSGFWRSMPKETAAARIAAMQQRFSDFASANPADSVLLDYSDLLNPGERLAALFTRLGVELRPELIAAVLARPHSYDVESVKFHDNARLQLAPRADLGRHFLAFNFDRLAPGGDGQTLIIAGTLLPAAEAQANVSSIYAVASHRATGDAEERISGQTGLASPGLAKAYPGHPHSNTARFRLEVPIAMGSAEVYAQIGDHAVRLGQVTLHGAGPRHFAEPSVGHSGAAGRQSGPVN
jgi:hypothetical protein